jgi:hypothetical protein
MFIVIITFAMDTLLLHKPIQLVCMTCDATHCVGSAPVILVSRGVRSRQILRLTSCDERLGVDHTGPRGFKVAYDV